MFCLAEGCGARMNCLDTRVREDHTMRRTYKCPSCGMREYTTELRLQENDKMTADKRDYRSRLIEMIKEFK